MNTLVPQNWTDYELLDSGDAMKLERWGDFVLSRPEPAARWPKETPELWEKADAEFIRKAGGTGSWKMKRALPEAWKIQYKDLTFLIKPATFKHTGIFPEQAVNWDWITEKIQTAKRPIKLLNLFGYTGAASVAAAKAGAHVTHIDASKGTNEWAAENAQASGIEKDAIRFLVDDALKFIAREKRRGNSYDAIIMDPPSYGRGAKGEVWKIDDHLWDLVSSATELLSKKPLFLIVNSYTTGITSQQLKNILKAAFKDKSGAIEVYEIGLEPKNGFTLPAGITGRWEA